MKYTLQIFSIALLLPAVASAQGLQSFGDILTLVKNLMAMGLAILMSLLSLSSIWLAFQYIQELRAGKQNAELRERMIWTIIGTAVIFALWGLVAILTDTFGFTIGIPQFSAPE